MKIPKPVILVLALTAISSLVVAYLPEIINGEVCDKDYYTGKKECPKYSPALFVIVQIAKLLDHHEGSVVGLGTIFVALFTWRLWISTNRLWSESIKAGATAKIAAEAAKLSAEISSAALVITQRAHLTVHRYTSAVAKGSTSQKTSGWDFSMNLENSGNTPANAVISGIRLQPIEPGQKIEQFGGGYPSGSPTISIGPKQTVPIVGFNGSATLTFAQAERVVAGDIKIFLCGYAQYRDIFEGSPLRETSVCMNVFIEDKTLQQSNPFRYHAHDDYNKTT